MNKILIASIFVMMIPLTGLPLTWKSIILFVIGLFIVIQTTLLKKEFYKNKKEEKEQDFDRVFVENERIENEY